MEFKGNLALHVARHKTEFFPETIFESRLAADIWLSLRDDREQWSIEEMPGFRVDDRYYYLDMGEQAVDEMKLVDDIRRKALVKLSDIEMRVLGVEPDLANESNEEIHGRFVEHLSKQLSVREVNHSMPSILEGTMSSHRPRLFNK